MTEQVQQVQIREQAELLASENRKSDPGIRQVYWFPHDREVRLVEISEEVPVDPDRQIHPFYFRPLPNEGLPAPSGIALIHPDEFRNVQLPPGWGNWDDAVEL